jgi:energy-coupling factor transporter ATP-binding protein EcfA2
MTPYTEFRILLDTPSTEPGLGFDYYARALTTVVRSSAPRFAVGIFGDWGSGKTTLMDAIRGRLEPEPSILTVEFNAWRYERERHLVGPLLDVLREQLEAWVKEQEKKQAAEDQLATVRRAARKLRRAARAFLSGVTVSAGVPGGPTIQVDAGQVAQAMEDGNAEQAESIYHAAFRELESAVDEFRKGGVERVVVFVDDLDRCFPASALAVLESMKLFFDLQGFVFVVGLDRDVIARAITSKHPELEQTADARQRASAEYLEKVFQVPFALPRIDVGQLEEYAVTLVETSGWSDPQKDDFTDIVQPHLAFLAEENSVNPREVKQLVNAYILQMQILSQRLGQGVNGHVVMALQVLASRDDWRTKYYEPLVGDPKLFQESLREAFNAPPGVTAAGTFSLLPSLRAYLSKVGGAVLDDVDLGPYVTSAESTRSSDPALLEALAAAQRTRAILDSTQETYEGWRVAHENLTSRVSSLQRLVGAAETRYGTLGAETGALAKRLTEEIQPVPPLDLGDFTRADQDAERRRQDDHARQRLVAERTLAAELESALIEMRRYSTVGLL